jgi:hypothetical protein
MACMTDSRTMSGVSASFFAKSSIFPILSSTLQSTLNHAQRGKYRKEKQTSNSDVTT